MSNKAMFRVMHVLMDFVTWKLGFTKITWMKVHIFLILSKSFQSEIIRAKYLDDFCRWSSRILGKSCNGCVACFEKFFYCTLIHFLIPKILPVQKSSWQERRHNGEVRSNGCDDYQGRWVGNEICEWKKFWKKVSSFKFVEVSSSSVFDGDAWEVNSWAKLDCRLLEEDGCKVAPVNFRISSPSQVVEVLQEFVVINFEKWEEG